MLNFKEYTKIVSECLILSKQKNKLYGTNSLKLFNGLGILTRINDKIARINNITQQKLDNNPLGLLDESLEDSIKDLINYSIYYLMYFRGQLDVD